MGNNEEELKIFQQRLQNSSETAYSLNKEHEMWEKQSSIPMICVESMDDENRLFTSKNFEEYDSTKSPFKILEEFIIIEKLLKKMKIFGDPQKIIDLSF